MKNLIFLLSVLFLVSCGKNSHEENINKTNSNIDSTKVENSVDARIDLSDPAYMAGSDFGHFFKKLYELGEYNIMLEFTSDESIEKYGEKEIVEHYKNMEFGYKLGNLKKSETENDVTTLYYLADIRATNVRVTMDIVVENDTCKLYIGDNIENSIVVNKEL